MAFAMILLATWARPQLAVAQQGAAGPSPSDARCDVLFEQAVSRLAAEQYPSMRKLAQDRMALCADPVSAFLLGLAEANIVDSLVVTDPAQREQLRRSALRHLRVAAAGGGSLEPRWEFTVHDWIVRLQELGGSVDVEDDEHTGSFEEDAQEDLLEPFDIPPAPAPQPRPVFPWGPLLVGLAGAGALTTGIVLRVQGGDETGEATKGAEQLLELQRAGGADPEQLRRWAVEVQNLHEEGQSDRRWGNGLIIGGGAALLGALIWYWALPPRGSGAGPPARLALRRR